MDSIGEETKKKGGGACGFLLGCPVHPPCHTGLAVSFSLNAQPIHLLLVVPSLSTWHISSLFFPLFFLAYFLGRLTRDMTTGERERERERELCNSNISYMTGPRQSFLPFPSPVVYAFPLAAGGGGGGYIDYWTNIKKSEKWTNEPTTETI